MVWLTPFDRQGAGDAGAQSLYCTLCSHQDGIDTWVVARVLGRLDVSQMTWEGSATLQMPCVDRDHCLQLAIQFSHLQTVLTIHFAHRLFPHLSSV